MVSHKQVLLPDIIVSVNEHSQGYFRVYLRHHLCLEEGDISRLSLAQSKKALGDFYCVAASTFAGGLQRYGGIAKGYGQFNEYVDRFRDVEKIHDLVTFTNELRGYWQEKLPGQDLSRIVDIPYTAWQAAVLLSYFHMFGLKIASLYLKMLILDLDFFRPIDEPILIPLERVNARVVNEICVGLGQTPLFLKEEVAKLHEVSLIWRFNQKAIEIMGLERQKYFDNLWFIGHFYCDGNRENAEKCVKRRVVEICEWPYLRTLPTRLPRDCPLRPICGKREPQTEA